MASLADCTEPAGGAWPTRPLDELTESLDHQRVPVKEADRRHGPYPYYGASGIVDRVDSYLFDGEYLLVAEDGENLRTLQTPIAFLATGKFWVNNHAHVLRANAENDTRFLMYALRATDVSGYLTGSTMPKLTKGSLGRVHVPAPRLAEQRAIAHILSTLDDKIELNCRTNETLEAMARALFKSWFVDFDPVRAKAAGQQPAGMDAATAKLFPSEFVESEIGEIPKGWPPASLGTMMELKRGYDLPQAARREGKVPIVSSSGYSGFHHESMARSPGIVTGRYGTIGKVFLVREDFWPLNTTLYVRDLKGSDPYFAYHLLQTINFQKFSDKAAVPGVNRNDLHEEPVVLPPQPIQMKFGEIAATQLDLLSKNESKTAALAQIRDALLPRLLSGELRIPDAERIVGTST